MDQFQQNQPTPEFKQSSSNPTTGPQFELVERGGWGRRMREWLNKYGSSVILPLIALIILASGIYLYATQKKQENSLLQENNSASVTLQDELTEIENEGIVSDEQIIGAITEPQQITEPVEPEIITEIIPEKRKDNKDVIVEKAEKGEGVTHLARKALKDYINNKQNKIDTQSLTKEHKIFIEDYLKDKKGSRNLGIGEEVEFSKDVIKEAIDASTKLTPEQLKVIEKYSALVVSL